MSTFTNNIKSRNIKGVVTNYIKFQKRVKMIQKQIDQYSLKTKVSTDFLW